MSGEDDAILTSSSQQCRARYFCLFLAFLSRSRTKNCPEHFYLHDRSSLFVLRRSTSTFFLLQAVSMPPINRVALAPVGVLAISIAVAAAIAVSEIPEVRHTRALMSSFSCLGSSREHHPADKSSSTDTVGKVRRAAEDLRRRLAVALRSLGDNVDPNREPRYNRPEDAEGFYESQNVEADPESMRRQREELMYWNMRREEQQQREQQQEPRQRTRLSSFDDFLQPAGESGTFVYNSGASAWDTDSSNVLRRRGNGEGVRGLNAAVLANPFSDEYAIELEDRAQLLSATRDEAAMSDIYNATPRLESATPVPAATTTAEVLFDFASHATTDAEHEHTAVEQQPQPRPDTPTTTTTRSATLDRELADDEYMTAGQDATDDDNADDVYASIQAWARNSASHNNAGFYSPLPTTPQAPVSEPEVISQGQLTPADSASVVEVGYEEDGGDDGMSETDGGVATPGSWSEVGSVVSEI